MMNYTVCILICRETDKVLLIKKDRTDFAGRYNGVGGKLEYRENPMIGAIREIREETGADVTGRIQKLGKLQLPFDCGKHDPQGCTLHYFTADVHESEISQQPGETEKLTWFPAASVIAIPACSKTLAGDGDLQYFTNMALMRVYNAEHGAPYKPESAADKGQEKEEQQLGEEPANA